MIRCELGSTHAVGQLTTTATVFIDIGNNGRRIKLRAAAHHGQQLFLRQIIFNKHSRTGAKIRIFTDADKYPRHISRFPHQWSSCRQIRDSQRVIAPKNHHFRPFLPYFGRSPLSCTADGAIWRDPKIRDEPNFFVRQSSPSVCASSSSFRRLSKNCRAAWSLSCS